MPSPITPAGILAATLAATLGAGLAGMAAAGPMRDAMDICSDPMTTGPQKLERLPLLGWEPAPADPEGALADLATAIIIGFTTGMPDLDERFSHAPVLAGNFARMAEQGEARLWRKGDASWR